MFLSLSCASSARLKTKIQSAIRMTELFLCRQEAWNIYSKPFQGNNFISWTWRNSTFIWVLWLFNYFCKKPLKVKNSLLQLHSAFRKSHLAGCHNIANFDMNIFVIHFSRDLMWMTGRSCKKGILIMITTGMIFSLLKPSILVHVRYENYNLVFQTSSVIKYIWRSLWHI